MRVRAKAAQRHAPVIVELPPAHTVTCAPDSRRLHLTDPRTPPCMTLTARAEKIRKRPERRARVHIGALLAVAVPPTVISALLAASPSPILASCATPKAHSKRPCMCDGVGRHGASCTRVSMPATARGPLTHESFRKCAKPGCARWRKMY